MTFAPRVAYILGARVLICAMPGCENETLEGLPACPLHKGGQA